MHLYSWLILILICTLGTITPGASFLMIIKNTLYGSRKNGCIAAISHGVGVTFYCVLTVTGLYIIITTNHQIYNYIMGISALYLLWTSWKILCSTNSSIKIKETKSISYTESALDGLALSFFNPKIIIFFIAIFSQFIHKATSYSIPFIIILVVTIDMSWYIIVATFFSKKSIHQWLLDKSHIIGNITAIIFIGLAINIGFLLFH